jgi:hypothetical protein
LLFGAKPKEKKVMTEKRFEAKKPELADGLGRKAWPLVG